MNSTFSRGFGDHTTALGFSLEKTKPLQGKQETESKKSLVLWVRGKRFKIHPNERAIPRN